MVGVRSKDHAEKRRLILDTAAALFAKQGFNKTSIAEISASCKASKAWIYHYFPTKEISSSPCSRTSSQSCVIVWMG